MRGLITIILIVVIGFFVVPMAAEGTVDSCKALERHVVSTQASKIAGNTDSTTYNTINSTGQAAANGQVASTMMQQNHPNAPTPVSCTYFWWKSLFQ